MGGSLHLWWTVAENWYAFTPHLTYILKHLIKTPPHVSTHAFPISEVVLDNITILQWNDDSKWHNNRYRRNFSIPKYCYHDIIVNIVIILSISQNYWSLQFKKFRSISNNVHDVSVYALLQLFYWYNICDISNDDYRRQKISISPITIWKVIFLPNSHFKSSTVRKYTSHMQLPFPQQAFNPPFDPPFNANNDYYDMPKSYRLAKTWPG